MSSSGSEELPEHQIFHVLRAGEPDSMGPFSQNELVKMLNDGQIRHSDLVYYPELSDWTRIDKVFEIHQQLTAFGQEGQDPDVVSEAFSFIDKRSEPDEEIYYIAVQRFPALRLTATVTLRSPKAIVLSSWRFCIVKPKLIGETTFEEFLLDQIESVEVDLNDGGKTGSFAIIPRYGDPAVVDQIPAAQLARLEEIAGEVLAKDPD